MNAIRNILVAVLACLSMTAPFTPAQADVLAGILKCQVDGGPSLIVGSRRATLCLYKPNGSGPKQFFTGTIDRFGLALGLRFAGTLMWNVHSQLHDVGSLEGDYTGAGGDAKFFQGPNGDVMVGGRSGEIYLRPLTAGGPTGFEISAGIGHLNLVRTSRNGLFGELDDDDIE